MELSPFWLGLSRLQRMIGVTNRALGDAASKAPQAVLSSGTPDMKHISFKDDKANYFVLKKTKKKTNESLQKSEEAP